MKLTHDNVRSLRNIQLRALRGCACPGNCACCDWSTTAVALADEWLARRTVRIDVKCGDVTNGLGEHIGSIEQDAYAPWLVVRWGDAASQMRKCVDTVAEARAWLEERAREAGYEIEGGAT